MQSLAIFNELVAPRLTLQSRMAAFEKRTPAFPILRFHHTAETEQIVNQWFDCFNQTQLPEVPGSHEVLLEADEHFAVCGFIAT